MFCFIGFGDLALQVQSLFATDLVCDEKVYFDDGQEWQACEEDVQPFSQFRNESFKDSDFIVCLGYRDMKVKQKVISELSALNRTLPSLIHDSCTVSKTSCIDKAVIVYPNSVLDHNTVLGAGTLLNNSVTVCHDTTIGESSYLAPGVVVCGNATVGARTFIGAGSVVSDCVCIGDDVLVGIGTAVTADLPSGACAIGNPMRVLDHRLTL